MQPTTHVTDRLSKQTKNQTGDRRHPPLPARPPHVRRLLGRRGAFVLSCLLGAHTRRATRRRPVHFEHKPKLNIFTNTHTLHQCKHDDL